MADRCPECGSWDAECGSNAPVVDCGCARCLRAANARLRADLATCQRDAHSDLATLRADLAAAQRECAVAVNAAHLQRTVVEAAYQDKLAAERSMRLHAERCVEAERERDEARALLRDFARRYAGWLDDDQAGNDVLIEDVIAPLLDAVAALERQA